MASQINTRKVNIEKAVVGGVDYIMSLQSEDGSWMEWELPPGRSTYWATAYIGYKLRFLPSSIKRKIKKRLYMAGNWLLDNRLEESAWGYNSMVGPDADSTAYAILFLISTTQEVPKESFAHLIGYQTLDGGFSTYRSVNIVDSWTVSHPDVTPLCLLALFQGKIFDTKQLKIGTEYVLKQRSSDYWWHSFWWSSRIYATEASISFLNAVKIPCTPPVSIDQYCSKNAFELALLISSLLYLPSTFSKSVISNRVEALTDIQQPDGSWSEAPILRITKHDCFSPWTDIDAGPLFYESKRLFTTATAVEALCRLP